MTIYQVKDWEIYFESAKSRTYKQKSSTIIPCKTGLGYMRLIKNKNGAALYGAWCALICLLSRQKNIPRQGFCTDNGLADGLPLTFEDISLTTHIPSSIISEMISVCSSKNVGWLDIYNDTDTIRIPQDTIISHGALNEMKLNEMKRNKTLSLGEFQNVKLLEKELASLNEKFTKKGTEERIEKLSCYMESKGKRYKSHYATILNWDKMNGNTKTTVPGIEATKAWQTVMKSINNNTPITDERIKKSLEAIGGRGVIKNAQANQIGYIQQNFEKNYKAIE